MPFENSLMKLLFNHISSKVLWLVLAYYTGLQIEYALWNALFDIHSCGNHWNICARKEFRLCCCWAASVLLLGCYCAAVGLHFVRALCSENSWCEYGFLKITSYRKSSASKFQQWIYVFLIDDNICRA